MATYRIYFLNAAGHVYGVDVADCETDAEAEMQGALLMARRQSAAVEVWQGAHRVSYAQRDRRLAAV
jgi:hypothetical protein